MVPDVLLPSITHQAEFVPFFLNLLRDWTSAAWSKSTCTPLKVQTPVTGVDHSASRSVTCDTSSSMPDHRTRTYSSMCTPDSNLQLDNRLTSAQRLASVKSHTFGPNDTSLSVFSPQEVSNVEHQSHSVTKHDLSRHRPLRQHSTVLRTEYVPPSTRERQGRALFIDGSATGGGCTAKKPAGKHRTPVRNRTEKMVKTPVPSFNLDSTTDFPDMKSSQRYFACYLFLYLLPVWSFTTHTYTRLTALFLGLPG